MPADNAIPALVFESRMSSPSSSKSVTLHDVAKAAGVSKATVSRVLAGIESGSTPVTAERVRQTALRLGYVVNSIAASLRNIFLGVQDMGYRAGPARGRPSPRGRGIGGRRIRRGWLHRRWLGNECAMGLLAGDR